MADQDLIEQLTQQAGGVKTLAPGGGVLVCFHPEGLQRLVALVAEECARECTLMRQPPPAPDRQGQCAEGHVAGFSKTQLFEYAYLDREGTAAAIRAKFKAP